MTVVVACHNLQHFLLELAGWLVLGFHVVQFEYDEKNNIQGFPEYNIPYSG